MKRKLLGLFGFGTGVFAGRVVYQRSFARRRDGVDVYFDDGSMVSFVEGSPEAETLLDRARCRASPQHGADRRARRSSRRARVPRGRLPAPLGQAVALLPRQVPLRDATRLIAPHSASGSPPPRASTRRMHAVCRPRARRGRTGRGCLIRVAPSIPHRAQGGEGVRDRQPNRRPLTSEATACASIEDVVTSGGALLDSVEALREAGLGVTTPRSASSTARKAAQTRSPAAECGFWPCFGQESLLRRSTAAKPHG